MIHLSGVHGIHGSQNVILESQCVSHVTPYLFHESQVVFHESQVVFYESLVALHESHFVFYESLVALHESHFLVQVWEMQATLTSPALSTLPQHRLPGWPTIPGKLAGQGCKHFVPG